MKEIAIVTGATRGLGRALCINLAKNNYHVIALGRDLNKLQELKEFGVEEFYQVDLKNLTQIEVVFKSIHKKHQTIDILVNNAGIYNEQDHYLEHLEIDALIDSLQINSFAPLKIIQLTIPFLKHSINPRVINISSGMGAIQDMEMGAPAYRMSKTLLNTITILFHHELFQKYKIRVNAICPGWVRTDMGGSSAPRSVDEGIAGIIWAIQTNTDGPAGKFLRDGKVIDW